jgi:hypothetical protein
MGFFDSSSSSPTTVKSASHNIGSADNGVSQYFSTSKGSKVIYNDIDGQTIEGAFNTTGDALSLANVAIDTVAQNSTLNLTKTLDFFGSAYSDILNRSDDSEARAQNNATATRAFAENLINSERQTSDDKLTDLITKLGIGFLILTFITQSKVFK